VILTVGTVLIAVLAGFLWFAKIAVWLKIVGTIFLFAVWYCCPLLWHCVKAAERREVREEAERLRRVLREHQAQADAKRNPFPQ